MARRSEMPRTRCTAQQQKASPALLGPLTSFDINRWWSGGECEVDVARTARSDTAAGLTSADPAQNLKMWGEHTAQRGMDVAKRDRGIVDRLDRS